MPLPRKVVFLILAGVVFIGIILVVFLTAQANFYKSAHFTIQPAKGWVAVQQDVARGELIIFKPSNQTGNYPNLTVIYDPVPTLAINDKIATFASLGFSSSAATLGKLPATKLTGSLPYQVINGSSTQVTVQETAILLQKDSAQYQIEYFYTGEKSDPVWEAIFAKMVDSFQL